MERNEHRFDAGSEGTRPRRARRRVAVRRPGQILPILSGIFLAMLGLLVLLGSGMDWNHLATSTGNSLSFRQSGLLGIVELGFGITLVWAAGFPGYGRIPMRALGVAAIAFGIALTGWSGSLASLFGGEAGSGWLFMGVGAMTVLGAAVPARATPPAAADVADLETPPAPAKRIPRAS